MADEVTPGEIAELDQMRQEVSDLLDWLVSDVANGMDDGECDELLEDFVILYLEGAARHAAVVAAQAVVRLAKSEVHNG